jgi:hypothetical protein
MIRPQTLETSFHDHRVILSIDYLPDHHLFCGLVTVECGVCTGWDRVPDVIGHFANARTPDDFEYLKKVLPQPDNHRMIDILADIAGAWNLRAEIRKPYFDVMVGWSCPLDFDVVADESFAVTCALSCEVENTEARTIKVRVTPAEAWTKKWIQPPKSLKVLNESCEGPETIPALLSQFQSGDQVILRILGTILARAEIIERRPLARDQADQWSMGWIIRGAAYPEYHEPFPVVH